MSASASASSTPESSIAVPRAVSSQDLPSPAAIDASCRWPVLFLLSKAVGWLVLGLILALIASIKQHGPGFLADTAWLTLGRVKPAAMNALLYGFASQGGLGLLIWMVCRLGRTPLLNGSLILFAGMIWNIGLMIGVIAILAGHSTGFQWLEMPRFVAFLLFVSYALIGIWTAITFHYRRERELFVSLWYLLAALFWFPWIYSAANYLLLVDPVRGVVQSTVNAWFTGNFLSLWLGPIAIAAVYYFIPKLTGRPIYSRSIAAFGFWTMALFAGWTGLTQLVGGPLPSWMISTSIAANFLLLIPAICLAINWHLTLQGHYHKARHDPTLGFIVFAAGAFLLASLESILISTRTLSQFLQFTYVRVAWTQLMILGVAGGAIFAGVHYIVPRLTESNWPSAKKARLHFLCTIAGVSLCFLALTIGGLIQGVRLNNTEVEFLAAVKSAIPFVGLSTLGLLLLLVGQIALLLNICTLACRQCLKDCFNCGCCDWLTALLPSKYGGKP